MNASTKSKRKTPSRSSVRKSKREREKERTPLLLSFSYYNLRNKKCVKLTTYEPELKCDHCEGFTLDEKSGKCVLLVHAGTVIYQKPPPHPKKEKTRKVNPLGGRYPLVVDPGGGGGGREGS